MSEGALGLNYDWHPEQLTEIEATYLRILQQLAPLALSSGRVEQALSPEHRALWSAAHALDNLLELAFIPRNLDLTKADEDTRQALRRFILWRQFTPHPVGDSGSVDFPEDCVEESQLEVYHQHGHWFATWLKGGEQGANASECDLRELMAFDHRPEERRLILVEVP